MPYYLDNHFLLDNPWITVVGCGGTGRLRGRGSSAASSRAADATVVLVDHDRVEPHNLLRQNFYPGDVGEFKSKALADRLAKAYTTGPVGYSVYPFREEARPQGSRYPGISSHDGLIIGCADNAAARRAMAECLPGDPCRWLIDAGNDTNWGQVLIGNVSEPVVLEEPPFSPAIPAHLAPAPTLQRPDLLTAVSTRPPDVDCAAALDLTDQDPTINQMMASLVLQVVRRIGGGHLPLPGPLPGHGPGDGNAVLRNPGGGGAAGGAGRRRVNGANQNTQRTTRR